MAQFLLGSTVWIHITCMLHIVALQQMMSPDYVDLRWGNMWSMGHVQLMPILYDLLSSSLPKKQRTVCKNSESLLTEK